MKLLTQYRNLPSQHINTLWEDVCKDGVKADKIREILLFYIHHRTCLPALQKVFDTLIIPLTGKHSSSKIKLLLFQCVEEICHWLDPECIVNTVKYVSNTTTTVELLNCFLINSSIPLPSVDDYVRLLSVVTEEKTTLEDGIKILTFVTTTCPSSVVRMLSNQVVSLLRYSRDAVTSSQTFSKPDVMEVDGTTAQGLCTALTLTTKPADNHLLSISVFSLLRTLLSRTGVRSLLWTDLLPVIVEYCSALVKQCLKNSINVIDKQLQSTILQEILHILGRVLEIEPKFQKEFFEIVRRIELHAVKTKDVTVCIRVWDFMINTGVEDDLTMLCLDDFIGRYHTQGKFSYDLTMLVLDNIDALAPSITKYYPNMLKIIATHPSSLVEEFIDIVPHLTENDVAVEVLHGLLDLPVVSATICIQQTSKLCQAGVRDSVLISLHETTRTQFKTVVSYFMRNTALPSNFENIFPMYQKFFSTIKELMNYGLVQTSSQIAPLLINSFLNTAVINETLCEKLLPTLLQRLLLLFDVPGYQKGVTKVVAKQLQIMIDCHPVLINSPCILKFISAASNSVTHPLVYTELISAIGKHSYKHNTVTEYFDSVECSLYEILAAKHSQPLVLLNVMTDTLTKLSSRNAQLIPRALNAVEKVITYVQASDIDKQVVLQHNKELKCLLLHPHIANAIQSTAPTKEELSTMNIMRILNHLSS